MAAKAGSNRRTGAGNGGDGRALNKGDNRAAIEEAERAQLISYISRLQAQGREVAKIKAVYDAARDEMTETFRLAKAAGFMRKEMQALLDDLACDTKDLVEAEERRRRFRDAVGLPNGSQLDMFNGDLPEEVRDEHTARANGYAAYFRGEERKPPEGTHPRHLQAWLKGWEDGQTATAWAMARIDLPPVEPDEPEEEPEEREKTRAELKAEEKAARESLEALGKSAPDDFEAAPEELSTQAGRRVLEARRAADEEAVEA